MAERGLLAQDVRHLPWWLDAPVRIGAGAAATLADTLFRGLAASCTITRTRHPSVPDHGRILALWHEDLFLWAICMRGRHRDHAWMQHPAAYVAPVHRLLEREGVRIVWGSGGAEGRAAVDALARHVAAGGDTVIAPDGPNGPPHVLKPGVLHLAAKSGAPIVPVRFDLDQGLRTPGWDRKRLPRPGAHLTMHLGEAIRVGGDPDAARPAVEAALAPFEDVAHEL